MSLYTQASANKEAPADDYADLAQLEVPDNRTLRDADAELLNVRKQYYKHISTLTHKCTKCQHASKKSQRDQCYNQACQDTGENKVKAKEDTSLYFDHNVLARQAEMVTQIPKSSVSEASQSNV